MSINVKEYLMNNLIIGGFISLFYTVIIGFMTGQFIIGNSISFIPVTFVFYNTVLYYMNFFRKRGNPILNIVYTYFSLIFVVFYMGITFLPWVIYLMYCLCTNKEKVFTFFS